MDKKRIKTPMHLAEIVPANSDSAVSMIPEVGSEVYLESMAADLTPNRTVTVSVVWDYGSQNEQIIQISNSPFKLFIGTGDGTKKVALVLTNLEISESVAMGGDVVVTEMVEVGS